ncbi:MAG TPA: hypothetical protein VG734_24890 [Lacunisphaera sp.]|nr:hypothetical protein [Lacunisphaera sp.]
MKTLRLLVNCLAAVVGLVGISWALFGPLLLLGMVTGLIPREMPTERTVLAVIVMGTAVVAVIGGLMLRQAWRHWRQPDQRTAVSVVGMTSLMLGLYSLQLTNGRNAVIPKLEGVQGSLLQHGSTLALIVVCYLVYRLALKPLAARAYPVAATSTPS